MNDPLSFNHMNHQPIQKFAFKKAGFVAIRDAADNLRRNLQEDVSILFGIFDTVEDLTQSYNGVGLPPPQVAEYSIMFAKLYFDCIPYTNDNATSTAPTTPFTGGRLPTQPGVDYCALLNIDSAYITAYNNSMDGTPHRGVMTDHTVYRSGRHLLKQVFTHPLFPNWCYVVITNTTDPAHPVQTTFYADRATQGIALQFVSGQLAPVVAGDVLLQNICFSLQHDLLQLTIYLSQLNFILLFLFTRQAPFTTTTPPKWYSRAQ